MADSGWLREERKRRLAEARLYVVTGPRREEGDLESFLEAILSSGCDIVQLRDKNADTKELLRNGEIFRDAAASHRALFILNDRPDVALALGADGVHLGQDDLEAGIARRIVGPNAIIGLSCQSPADHAGAPREADYLTAGPVYATPTKPGREPAGLALVKSASKNVAGPWFAIGGINEETIAEVLKAGATKIAVVRAVTEAPDPGRAARALRSLLR